MSSSAKRAHTIPPVVSQILLQSDVEMETASVQRDAMRVSSMRGECVDQPDMEACFDTAGECHDCDAGQAPSWNVTVAGIRAESTQMQKYEMFKRRRKSKRSPTETVISTKTFHKAKRETRSSRES